VFNLLRSLLLAALAFLKSRRELAIEILALRHQLVGGLHHRHRRRAA